MSGVGEPSGENVVELAQSLSATKHSFGLTLFLFLPFMGRLWSGSFCCYSSNWGNLLVKEGNKRNAPIYKNKIRFFIWLKKNAKLRYNNHEKITLQTPA